MECNWLPWFSLRSSAALPPVQPSDILFWEIIWVAIEKLLGLSPFILLAAMGYLVNSPNSVNRESPVNPTT
jgi:hypothetical protein